MKRMIFLFLLLLISFSFAQDLYPTTVSDLDATVIQSGSGTISNLLEGEEVKFQTLTFQESDFQKTTIIKEELYINGKTFYPKHIFDEFGNKYVQFAITENGDFVYELIANIKTSALLYKVNDYNLGDSYSAQISDFLKDSEKIESNSNEIITVANNKLTTKSFIQTLNKTIFWVNDYVEYASGDDFQKYYLLQKSAINTLLSKKGVCDEFANLAAGLLRAKNIPTRLAIGITYDGKEWGNHAWLEVYHKDLGWIPSDPTFREPGFVDATHIKLGSFSDVTQSLAKATFPSTANVIFQTQTLPIVTVNDSNYFSHVTLKWNEEKLIANSWNKIKLTVKNNTNGILTIPVKIKENYSELIFAEKTKSISLNGGESGELIFEIYPKINLNENELAKGNLTFNSLTEPYVINFEINNGREKYLGQTIVKDVTPIALFDKLRFEITILNNSKENEIITININEKTWEEEINSFSIKDIRKELSLDENNLFNLKIETPTEIYTQTIYSLKTKNEELPKEEEKNIVTQKIDVDKNKTESGIEGRPELIILILLPIVAILLLIIFATKKRYV